jgi:ABC-type glycerol-3-phosphate transport system substrate-binding protein
MRKLFIFILTAAFLLSALGSCAEKSGSPPPDGGASVGEELAWQSKFYKTENYWWDMSHPFVTGESVYFFQTQTVRIEPDEWDEMLNVYEIQEPRLYSCNLDGSGFALVEGYKPSYILPKNADGRVTVIAAAFLDDKSFCVMEVSEFSYLDETGENYVAEYKTTIRLIDIKSGSELASIDAGKLLEAYPNISIDYMTVTENGKVITASEYFNTITYARKVVTAAFDLNSGSCEISEYEPLQGSISLWGLTTLPDGTAAAIISADGHSTLFNVEETSGKVSDSGMELPYSLSKLAGFTSDGAFIYHSYSGLASFQIGDKESSEFLNWLDCDIDSYNTTLLGIPNDNTVVCLTQTPGVMTTEQNIVIISKVPKSETTQKKVLTLACDFLPYGIQAEVLQFNKSNSEYRIKVEDYTKYDSGSEMYGGKTKLNIDMIGGNAPDILVLDGLPYDVYASRGLLEDLYQYIDADTELGGRGGITEAFRNVSETPDGKLFFAASSFKIMTLLSNSEFAGSSNSWTVYDMIQILTQNDGMRLFSLSIREIAVTQILQANLDAFVNWETGETSFDSPEFIKLIELVNTIPSESEQHINVEEILNNYEDPEFAITEWRQLAEPVTINTFADLMETAALFGDRDVYKGYPCAKGQGSFLYLYDTIGITSKCSDKAAAWEFVRRMFGANYQSKQNYYFPTNNQLFGEQVNSLMTPDYKEDNGEDWENGFDFTDGYYRMSEDGRLEIYKGVESAYSPYVGGYLSFPYYAMTQEQYDRFMTFINGIDKVWSEDQTLANIVAEELAPFFAGQKDAESAVKIIQSRAEIYVNEQR